MESTTYRAVLRVVKLLNLALMTAAALCCWCLCYAHNGWDQTGLLVAVIYCVLYMTYGRIYESFLISLVRITEMVYSQALALLMSDGILYLVLSLMERRLVAVMPMLGLFAAQLLISVLWSVCAHKWYFASFAPKRTAVIHDRGRDVGELIGTYGLSKKFEVCRTATLEECLEGNFAVIEGMQTVFLCGISSHDRNLILKQCVEKGITVYVLPKIGDIIMSGAKQMHLFHLPFLRVGRYDPAPEYLFLKRLFDVVVSGCALIVLSPVMLLVGWVVRRDGGPAFYRQCRLTKDGRRFDVLKFRSMRVDAEKDGKARLASANDDRITPVGHFIRKVRIDELPQLINILRGDMSIVGPRPERPEIAAEYEKELPEFSLRLQAKAGLTGYAQVYGKYNTTPYDKLQMDLMYIANPSFWEDLRIIFATIKILFLPESTEGVAEGQETAMKK
ncbi:MAG: exopolysaccharide biosynthesis polyprenyl glycosylphosphotransferase [Oscillospiraceae bacterium]|nr:exopolysaccharide biosynthesis polyprenyl glycosylphosphotransferase [Oscillospiraceae bacterium]